MQQEFQVYFLHAHLYHFPENIRDVMEKRGGKVPPGHKGDEKKVC